MNDNAETEDIKAGFMESVWKRWDEALRSLLKNPWIAYGTIFLLQLKVIWRIWELRDLTSGDTSSYYRVAMYWFARKQINIAWSPLYTAFYGSLIHLSRDPYTVTILHRTIIVLALALLVLGLTRRLLPPSLAWFVAAWWVVLPINFDALYEIHLFAVIPVIIVWLVLLHRPGPLGRGISLAIFLTATFLMRNELSMAFVLFALLCLVHDVLEWKIQGRFRLLPRLAMYAVPLFVSLLIVIFTYERSTLKYPKLREALRAKHELNVAQIYAFNYQQRHLEYTSSPWTDYQDLMTRTFGKPLISMGEAVRKNPKAMYKYFMWNLQLVPSGLQVLLFNEMSGTITPDYAPHTESSSWAEIAGIGLLGLFAAASFKLLCNWRFWWSHWLQPRAWGLAAMLISSSVVFVVMLMQRPRPSYMFPLGLTIMALSGLSLMILFNGIKHTRILQWASLFGAGATLALAPSFYEVNPSGTPLLDLYRRLEPFRELIVDRHNILAVPGYPYELASYYSMPKKIPKILWYQELSKPNDDRSSFASMLDDNGITLYYADESVWKDPLAASFLSDPTAFGWETLAFEKSHYQRWMLLQRLGASPKTN